MTKYILALALALSIISVSLSAGYARATYANEYLKVSENIELRHIKHEVKKKPPVSSRKTVSPQGASVKIIPQPSAFVNSLNRVRVSYGLKPLMESASLDASARSWANVLASRGYYNSGSACSPHRCGHWEVAAYSCGLFNDILQAWLNSSAHRAILLGNFTQIGYARVDSGGCSYYVAELE